MMEKRPMVCVTDQDGKMYPLGGNMRLKVLKELGYKEIKENWVMLADDWSVEQQREFTIKDNVSFGAWDWDILANEWDSDKLMQWGLNIPDYDKVEDLEDGDEIEFAQSAQLIPPKEYIVIMCEPNSEDWEEMKEVLKLEKVRRGGYKDGSAFDAIGLERVIEWENFKKRYNVNSSAKQK